MDRQLSPATNRQNDNSSDYASDNDRFPTFPFSSTAVAPAAVICALVRVGPGVVCIIITAVVVAASSEGAEGVERIEISAVISEDTGSLK